MVIFIKSLFLASIALFFSLVVFGNVVDYGANWQFVQHVMSMDTTFKDPAIMGRAITDIKWHRFAYSLIIIWQALVAIICWLAALMMVKSLFTNLDFYRRAKQLAILGLGLGFLLYMLVFIIVGGEWFAMWQSKIWSGQQTAGLFASIILLVLIFISMPE